MSRSILLRTPKDDSPPCEPTLWQNDCAFVTTWEAATAKEARNAEAASRTAKAKQAETKAREAVSEHVLPPGAEKPTLVDQLLEFFIGPPTSAQKQLKNLATEDLAERMRRATQSGSSDEAAAIAGELARRKVDFAGLLAKGSQQVDTDAYVRKVPAQGDAHFWTPGHALHHRQHPARQ